MIAVFDFGFGQRGLATEAPVDGLETFIDIALIVEVDKGAGDGRLVGGVHGFVNVIPAAEDTKALEVFGLKADIFVGVTAADLTDLHLGHRRLFGSELSVDFDLNRQAMAIETGDIGRIETGHGFRFDDEIFEQLVESVTQVNFAIGVRRPIVQNVFGATGAGRANAVVEIHLLPAGEHFRLILRQVRFHRESGFWQVNGFLEVH